MLRRSAFALVVLLAACGQPKSKVSEAPAAPPPPEPTPALVEWVGPMIGQPIATAFPKEVKTCFGFAEAVNKTYADGVALGGWAWNSAAKGPFTKILVTNDAGLIQGGGNVSLDRPDVPATRPDLKNPKVGYEVLAKVPAPPVVTLYGVDEKAKTRCFVGQFGH